MRAIAMTRVAALAAAVALVAGCSSTSTTTDGGADGAATNNAATTQGADGSNVTAGSFAEVAKLRTVFYFDFDQAVVKQEGFSDLEAHAKYLSNNPGATVRLEGHADERGTREYNIALGEQRANAVARLLMVNGAGSNQIETISYGEEKPAMLGHTEAEWALNRRVELSYTSR
ncbi:MULTISPECIES: peptidoglycan-associated lipoprotein Pal [unclassified Marinobacterium]|jgi:peptidoglycan-associated lipoprotein|uniref:peptidoglycan-associated lipoprotein Pal n=1 Tax=unclassified Marinobacterium TaxID=2644139 RepID=UPI0015689303|nr:MULTISPECIES: peptidoglycan-associated lipoprotein Pal [unclassified Marinobacterium]NRP09380.1 Peptidoglycan-associated lipoprotein precursor [Marinobacterium sp. xm-g-48]NRP16081.1 Peptidoglycan-associated lipoprotein precursor [Marinobacterium sp. xm-a-152]NRP26720.1 Peptidoglycan-associated lipoprotein precursor [Marinobacterium sp. xm-d-420]NRP35535.1 Peptidoglycan-associated lipoprotein precursor [Marinobacterium sp. xm-d-579]NRP37728.1 Peptidoglycan-associated lipoprotein precursor [